MTMKHILSALLATALVALPATAQKDYSDPEKPQPYTFITLQGGGQVTFSNPAFNKLVTPIGAFSLGRFFTPVVGTRINVQGFKSKSGYRIGGVDQTYKFKYVTTDLDVLFNLSNAFCPNRRHVFNAYLLGGFGLTYAWDNNDQQAILTSNGISEPLAWTDNRLVHNFRIGMQFELALGRHVGINLELAANNLHDRFNAKLNGKGDWQVTGLLGLTFKFGYPKTVIDYAPAEPIVLEEPVEEETPVEEPVEETPAPAPAPAPKEKEKIRTEIFFGLGKYTVSDGEEQKVATLAAWLKRHPDTKVYLTAYADKGTGNAEINRAISEKRVKNVAKLLEERHGIEASRIVTDYKGDTVQPFADNDSNRVTIGVAEEE